MRCVEATEDSHQATTVEVTQAAFSFFLKMKIHGKGGLLDFSKEKLTERNKENSFLDVDWIIAELVNYGHEKLATCSSSHPDAAAGKTGGCSTDVPNTPTEQPALLRTASLKNVTKPKKKVSYIDHKLQHSFSRLKDVFAM